MRPRDWSILGMRLFAIYLAVLAIWPLTDAIQHVDRIGNLESIRFFIQGVVVAATTALVGLVLWKTAPRITTVLLPYGQHAKASDVTARDVLTIGFVLAGIFLAASAVTPLLVNLQSVVFPAPVTSGHLDTSFEEIHRRQSIAFVVGSVVEGGIGLLLAFGASRFATRASISKEAP